MTDLRNARIVECDVTTTSGPHRLLLTRDGPRDEFRVLGVDGHVPPSGWERPQNPGIIANAGKNVDVLATFPLALADLLPDGCTRFEFHNDAGYPRIAHRIEQRNPVWEVTGMHGEWQDLNALQFDCAVELNTVIPLQVSDQYVEERR